MGNRIALNSTYEHQFSFSQDDVINFAKVTGDKNPIHLDEEYARNTAFKKRILHGFLGASVFSKVFGTLFPGEGTIYLRQNVTFHKPMYAGIVYEARFTIIETIPEKHRALVKTEIFNGEKELVISGEALIMHHNIF